ncbi:ParB/RepB/Spo0J family partition protein [Marisediminicola senii]|uniref:ParB/RepB/Spo0J family partition protein n=1 Tax=Marisediminicola senii TaxID=2711233 RepID=UPI0013EC1A19|nr:ParB/RepB/Spo0J family partition protein [Marisediminicola senii]
MTQQLLDLTTDQLVLPLDGNIRTDTRLDKEFLASIKARGIITPVLVTANDLGTYDILDGQRRTLAAIEAKLTTIPCIVTTTRDDQARVVDQLIVNDHRTGLTDAEHAGAFKQLALFGLTPAQISKRTSTPKDTVTAAITVANNETATRAMTEHQVNLTQAVVIAEFDDDNSAVATLIKVAENQPAQFEHAVAEQRKKRELKEHRAALVKQIEAEGINRLADLPSYGQPKEGGYTSISRLARSATPTVALTPEDLHGNPDAAAAVRERYEAGDTGWKTWAFIDHFVKDAESHGFVPLVHAGYQHVPEDAAAREEREREEAERDAYAAAAAQATQVREAFVSELLERPTLPSDTITFIAWCLTYDAELYYGGSSLPAKVLDWLGLSTLDDPFARGLLSTRPKMAMAVTLALVLHSLEGYTARYDSRYDMEGNALVHLHLTQLRAWGYGLSDHEKNILTDTTPAPAEPVEGDSTTAPPAA